MPILELEFKEKNLLSYKKASCSKKAILT